MKKLFLISAAVLSLPFGKGWGWALLAQQDVQFSQYMFNTEAVNAGYTGTRDALSLLALHRSQWIGFEGAPVTETFNVNAPVYNKKLGLGLCLVNDKIGPIQQTGAFADVAYRIKFESSNLSFGLKTGADVYQARLTKLSLINAADDQFQNNVSSKLLPNLGFGIYYFSKTYYIGFSTPKLVQNNINIKTGDIITAHLSAQKMHYFLIFGYVYDISPFIKFKPSAQAKFTYGAPFSLDVNASFLFYEKLWLGGMYRAGDAFGAMAQVQITSQLRAGYAYDYTVSKLRTYTGGTHEIMLGYDFNFSKEKIKSPRYF